MSGQKNIKINKTEYFDVIYAEGSEVSAKIIYDNADRLYKEISEEFGMLHTFRLPVVISPAQDDFNAYFSNAPFNHIVMYDTAAPESMAVFSDEVLNTFRHELIHAITYMHKNNFWFGVGRVFGDVINPALLTVTVGVAEGATVSIESDSGEGRVNDDYSMHLLKQAKIDGKFPNAPGIQGAMDVYPSTNVSYLFGGAFSSWLQKEYGMEKYASFWYKCVNLQTLSYFGCFKKVYGIKLKEAWKKFYKTIEVPYVYKNPEDEEFVIKPEFKNSLSYYPTLTGNKGQYFYYDLYKRNVYQVKDGKRKVLYRSAYVDRLSVSKDGRFLVESYTSEAGKFPIHKIRILDLEKKEFFYVNDGSLRDGTVIKNGEDYYLAAVYTHSAFSTLKVYKINLKRNHIKKLEAVYEQEFPVTQQLYSLEGTKTGTFYYVLKDKLEFSIRQFDLESKATSIFKLPEERMVVRNLNVFENNENSLVSFSFTKKGSMPRIGILQEGENSEFLLQEEDISGGIYNPVLFEDGLAAYQARFFNGAKIYKADITKMTLENVEARKEVVTAEETLTKIEKAEGIDEFVESSSDFSAFDYIFNGQKGVFLPVSFMSTYKNKSMTEVEGNSLLWGATYICSTPWTNPIWYVSAGYGLMTNSGGLMVGANGGTMTSLFNYNFSAQVEFDDEGYKQSVGQLELSSKIPLGGISYMLMSENGTIIEGRQSETEIPDDIDDDCDSLVDYIKNYFDVLETGDTDYLFISNSSALAFGNIQKSGFGFYDYSGIQLSGIVQNSYLGIVDNKDVHDRFDNLCLDLLIKNSCLIPLTFEAVLFPSDNYIGAAMVKGVLFNQEIQAAINFIPWLYMNRFTVSSYYVGKFAHEVESWALFNADKYFDYMKEGDFDYTDELALVLGFGFTPNLGGLARPDFLMNLEGSFKYRFNPTEKQKRFAFSIGLNSAF